jgi:hypothetical protein
MVRASCWLASEGGGSPPPPRPPPLDGEDLEPPKVGHGVIGDGPAMGIGREKAHEVR